jgi:hypothetical protein
MSTLPGERWWLKGLAIGLFVVVLMAVWMRFFLPRGGYMASAKPLLQQPPPPPLLLRVAPLGSRHGSALLSESMLPSQGRWDHRTDT